MSLLEEIVKPRSRAATPDEVELFRATCERTGLDPLARQIYPLFRRDKSGAEHMTVQATIDGLRAIAERSESYLGADPTQWCGPDGELVEVWLKSEPPLAARVTVRRLVHGHVATTTAVAHWAEYAPNLEQARARMWKQMPALMLAKVAEALALRRAFPLQLSGIYTSDEVAQSGESAEPPSAKRQSIDDERVAELRIAAKGLKWGDIKACYELCGFTAPAYAKQAFLDLTEDEAARLFDALEIAQAQLKTDVPVAASEMTLSPEGADDLPWGEKEGATEAARGDEASGPAPKLSDDELVQGLIEEFDGVEVEGA